MKKNLVFILFLAILAFFSYTSCKSAPPPPPAQLTESPPQQQEPQQEPTPEPELQPKPEPVTDGNQAIQDELNAAIARAEGARKRAVDFESPSYFPGEWEDAEALYSAAKLQPTGSEDEMKSAITRYNAAADSYDSCFKLTIPLFAQAREDEIMEIRYGLIDMGAKDSFPEYFVPADETSLLALDQYEAEDYYAALDSAASALSMYQVMETAYEAWLLRLEIDAREFGGYDPDNYDRAGEILGDAMDAYNAGKIPEAGEIAADSRERYEMILHAGWTAYAELRSSMADAERQAAMDIKADIAVKDLFKEGDSSMGAAASALDSRNYEEAAKQFVNAEAMYIITSMSASEKRQKAAEAIRRAAQKIEDSDENAREAESIIEGGLK